MIVAGIGFRTGASAEAILDALLRAEEGAGLGPVPAAAAGGATAGPPCAAQLLAAPRDKADDPALQAAAHRLGLPILPVDADALCGQPTLTQSPRVIALRGTGSVAEACALAAAGPGARLGAPRAVSRCRMATAAIARNGEP